MAIVGHQPQNQRLLKVPFLLGFKLQLTSALTRRSNLLWLMLVCTRRLPMVVLTTQLLVVVVGTDQEETRARTPATNVEKPDTGLASANLPSRMDPPNQPRHPKVSSMLVAMSNQQLDGRSPRLRKPSLVGTRSTNGAQNAVVERDATTLIMSPPIMTLGGPR